MYNLFFNQAAIDELSYEIVGCAIEVHKHLGPGLLESVYHQCLAREFDLRGIKYESEFLVNVHYKGDDLDTRLRCDFLVEDTVVVELKAVERLIPVTDAQLLTYMHLLEKPKGVLINFNVKNIFYKGQKTMVNELYRKLPKV